MTDPTRRNLKDRLADIEDATRAGEMDHGEMLQWLKVVTAEGADAPSPAEWAGGEVTVPSADRLDEATDAPPWREEFPPLAALGIELTWPEAFGLRYWPEKTGEAILQRRFVAEEVTDDEVRAAIEDAPAPPR